MRSVVPPRAVLALALSCAALACGGGKEPAAPASPAAGAAPPRRPNVLLITLDSTRRDFLGTYGYRSPFAPGVSDSPRLDRLAGEGVLFEDAHSTTSWTLPSHASILSGEPEIVHGVDLDYQRPDPRRPLLAERLKEQGYRTAGFYSGPYLDPRFGFDRGFDRYESRYGDALREAGKASEEAQAELARLEKAPGTAPAALADARQAADAAWKELEVASRLDHSSKLVADGVIEELRGAREQGEPLFVFAHFFDPHYDYVPPAPWDRAFDPDYTGAITGEDFYSSPKIAEHDPDRPLKVRRVVSDRDLEHVRQLYAGDIASTDAEIGRVLDELDRLGLAQDTLVVVTADHGDEFFEHGGIGHRSTLFEELVRVPLILRLPGALPAGVRVAGPVSTIDVVPTVLDLLHLPLPEGSFARSLLASIAAGRAEEHAVLGRLVRHEYGYVKVPKRDAESGALPALLLTLEETYRKGSIKITRERRWIQPNGSVSPRTKRVLEKRNDELRSHETLLWIDLAAAPAEPVSAESSDFSDPRALAALRDFHDSYERLLARRGHADLIAVEDTPLAALQGLGYTGAGSPGVSLGGDDFRFPPPGEAVLEAGRGR